MKINDNDYKFFWLFNFRKTKNLLRNEKFINRIQ